MLNSTGVNTVTLAGTNTFNLKHKNQILRVRKYTKPLNATVINVVLTPTNDYFHH